MAGHGRGVAQAAGDPFADWMNSVDKHVVSNTLSEADLTWAPTSLIREDDLAGSATALRERPGRDVTSWAARSSCGRCSRPTSSTS